MSTQDNGGPAFPVEVDCTQPDGRQTGNTLYQAYGMTLRDYLATHSVQPGMGEIASMAGLTYSNGGVWSDPITRIAGFDEWFNRLPLDERLSLYARVKYAMADAMLKERAK